MCCGSGSSPRAGCTARRAPPSPPGGKGINVSAVLQNFGVPSVATGFVAGDVGEIICRKLEARGIETDFIRIPGQSRVNVKIKGKEETEINASGPDIPREALETLAKKLSGVPAGSVLVLAGSVPASLPKDIYERLLAALARPDLRVVADASGELLLDVLPFRPWLIKPNRDELDETFGRHMRSVDEALSYAEKLRTMGRAQRHRQHGRGRRDDGHRLRLLLPVRLCGGSRGHRRRGATRWSRASSRPSSGGKDDREALRFAVAAGWRHRLPQRAWRNRQTSAPSSPAAERI